MKRLYQFILQSLITLPYCRRPCFNKPLLENVRSATNVIRFWEEIHGNVAPKHLVDVGANVSQWTHWLVERWPDISVDSFEPDSKVDPKHGRIIRKGLSDVSEPGKGLFRFEELTLPIGKPAILKVDCEEYTAKALRGFGSKLGEFDLVVAECWNNKDDLNQQFEIAKIMIDGGFKRMRLVDVITFFDSWPLYELAFSK